MVENYLQEALGVAHMTHQKVHQIFNNIDGIGFSFIYTLIKYDLHSLILNNCQVMV